MAWMMPARPKFKTQYPRNLKEAIKCTQNFVDILDKHSCAKSMQQK